MAAATPVKKRLMTKPSPYEVIVNAAWPVTVLWLSPRNHVKQRNPLPLAASRKASLDVFVSTRTGVLRCALPELTLQVDSFETCRLIEIHPMDAMTRSAGMVVNFEISAEVVVYLIEDCEIRCTE
ncbi:hypothetical protein [Amycolatopsis sp. BJA-103]|uniref:hypothetical protein n=1 Tax=Amycolatopsis sp. BJA-103 TaxID=1911175 RepID=UPI0011AF2B54|nr:hypothetical protein [Amycolatopsis sp. BJA-103]